MVIPEAAPMPDSPWLVSLFAAADTVDVDDDTYGNDEEGDVRSGRTGGRNTSISTSASLSSSTSSLTSPSFAPAM